MRALPVSVRSGPLVLRLLDEEHARLEHEMILESLDHLWPWFSFKADPPSLDERLDLARRVRGQAAEGTAATYVVFACGRPVGDIWIEVHDAVATIGWWLRASATGHGHATEALRALTTLAFDFGIERIEAFTDPDNAPSRAVAERAGFVLKEIRPDAHDRPDGVRRPVCVYVLLPTR